MLTVIMSAISFIFIFSFFIYEFNKTNLNSVVKILSATLLSLPALKLNSVLFIFEVHFVVITIVFEFLFKKIIKSDTKKYKKLYMCIPIPLILSISLMYFGFYNMNHILKTEYNIDTEKSLSKDYKIAMIADLHYPTSTNEEELNQLVDRIANENPDFVMLCGDIIDENTTPQERIDTFETLGKLSQTSQVLYVYGNHDTGKHSFNNRISSKQLESLIENYGIQVLNDEQIQFNNEISIIGRKDYSLHERFNMNEYPKNDKTYNIVIDHQPKNLNECAQNNIDLHLSGHTHAGQIFPLYYVYELLNINELNYGLKEFDQMSAINTSGVSGWGFPIRTEHHSEFMIIHIHS